MSAKNITRFITSSLALLERECRDRLVTCPLTSEMHQDLWLKHLQATYDTPVLADDERCAWLLVRVDQALRALDVDVRYQAAQNATEGEHGRWRADGTMWVRPGRPSRMLQTMLHESAHMLAQVAGVIGHLSDEANEVVAESVAYVVMRALGIDSLAHSSAYLSANHLNGHIPPGALRPVIVPVVEALLSVFDPDELRGVR
jgi:hypothetical protein